MYNSRYRNPGETETPVFRQSPNVPTNDPTSKDAEEITINAWSGNVT